MIVGRIPIFYIRRKLGAVAVGLHLADDLTCHSVPELGSSGGMLILGRRGGIAGDLRYNAMRQQSIVTRGLVR